LEFMPDHFEKQAFFRCARHNRNSRLAALSQSRAVIQNQTAFLSLAAVVTGIAMLDQDGANAFLEELEIFRRGLVLGYCRQNSQENNQDADENANTKAISISRQDFQCLTSIGSKGAEYEKYFHPLYAEREADTTYSHCLTHNETRGVAGALLPHSKDKSRLKAGAV